MKRVWLVSLIAIAIIVAGIISLIHLSNVTNEMESILESLSDSVQQKDTQKLAEQTKAFEVFWEKSESVMMRYIHHDALDNITGTIARLNALARYEDYSELSAEIDRLRHLIRHIYESELPTLRSVF